MVRPPAKSRLLLYLLLAYTASSPAQEKRYVRITDSIAAKVARLTGYQYDISGIDVDKSKTDPESKIRDPYHTLAGCFIFLAADETDDILTRPKGFIGIYRIETDSIVWRSVPLSEHFLCGVMGQVEETRDLLGDGKVEIIVSQLENPPAIQQYWIFSWDGLSGQLITQLDQLGESTIKFWGGDYDVRDIDHDGIFEIQGLWYKNETSDAVSRVTYSWNGTLYGKWGKSSRSLMKGRKK